MIAWFARHQTAANLLISVLVASVAYMLSPYLLDYSARISVMSATRLTSAPRSIRSAAMSASPVNAAVCSGVSPPSATFWASVLPMLWFGLVPVFCESEPERMGLDPQDIERKITERTRAIVIINPNNPTGAVYSRETLEAMVALAEHK